MSKKTHLKEFEREKIEYWLRLGFGNNEIARKLARSGSSVSDEIRRNSNPDGKYTAADAQRRADQRRERKKGRKLERDAVLHDYVVSLLRGDGMLQGWAPDAIAGRLKHYPELVPEELRGKTVSHEAIYQYIYEGEGKWEALYHHLPRKRSRRRIKEGRKTRQQSKIPNRVSIRLRPAEVNERKTFGDWESDTFEGTGSACGSVQVERKSRKIHLHRTADKTKEETERAIRQTIESYPEYLRGEAFRTMTLDNGGEGANHGKLRREYGIDTYFCDPYCSWQKGSVENAIGLVRLRFIPKKTNLSTLSDREFMLMEDFLNDMPGKSLGHLTPNEVAAQYL
ncbi:IS30 family transposase [Patescibacteria group bacterium]|nr:IS30 family transposase [Patescibacteria group bacterium]MBU1028899.1 IS30 family transposase [Patescibacteria group bacterium]MBU1915995.1 IS30 family transposase [Patescibacteria group bacterium]